MEKQQSEFQKLQQSCKDEIYRHNFDKRNKCVNEVFSKETLKIASNLLIGDTMKSSIRDQAEGTFHEVKGKVKEVAGKLSDNPKLEVEGTVEKVAGKVQEKIGQVKKVWGNSESVVSLCPRYDCKIGN